MKIGDLASKAGVDAETIRFYEKAGIIPEPHRSSNGYRKYGPTHLERLVFVRNCRSLDMSLDEIRILLHFKDAPTENCSEVNEMVDEHILHVRERLNQLQELSKQLMDLRNLCHETNEAANCQILHKLGQQVNLPKVSATKHLQSVHIKR